MKIKVYFFDDLENFNHELFLPLLSCERREKALSYRHIIDQKLCVAAFLLLRLALREVSFFDEPVISKQERGKPILLKPEGIHFNLSHCSKGTVCAVAEKELGIDIQDVRPISQSLVEKTMSKEEKEFISDSADKDSAFALLWSKKESILKQSGEGIGRPLASINTLDKEDIDSYKGEGFCISLSGGKIDLVNVRLADLLSLLY